MASRAAYQQGLDQFSDWRWRLNNLYWITDKEGLLTRFEMNWAQQSLFGSMHYMNAILKARQLGFTTFIQLFMLDAAVFNSNIRAGTIAHTLQDAQAIFKDKVKFPYDNLPDQIRERVKIVKDNATELELSNNSSIRVGTSLRSGTLQYLHISEYGKVCAKFPEKAREIRTGALNTVQAGQIVFVESTAEGQEGHFYDLCETAKAKDRQKIKLTPMDFKFHFYPWWKNPEYEIDPDGVVIDDLFRRYFERLDTSSGIVLNDRKRAWYVKKAETQLDDMKREFPSTPEEAFEASVEGAYYGQQMARADMEERIGLFPADPNFPVDTAWDIGYGDETAIWFFQVLPGAIRLVGYYENSGEGMPHYLDEMEKLARANGWRYRGHYLPHDIRVHEWTNGLTRIEQMLAEAARRGLGKVHKVPDHSVEDGINAVRHLLSICQFDAGPTQVGTKALRNYRKEWDEERGCWKDKPRHDWASHGADAKRSLAMVYRELKPEPAPPPPGRTLTIGPDITDRQITLNDLWNAQKPRARRRI